MSDLSVNFLDHRLKNPFIAASGTFGFGDIYTDFFSPEDLGGFVCKGITCEARSGNVGIRLAETPSGMLNSIGLHNPGLEVFEREILPNLSYYKKTIRIANINGSTYKEYEKLAERANFWQSIDMIELNISCPNVEKGGMIFGTDPIIAKEITSKVKTLLKNKPLIVKLSPNALDISEIALAVEDGGADAVSLINTILGMSIDVNKKSPVLGNIFGGLSGPAIKPIALRMLWQVRKKITIPILAGGGISTFQDVLEFLMAGADAISLGTIFFSNPLILEQLVSGLKAYMVRENLRSLKDIIGIAHCYQGD